MTQAPSKGPVVEVKPQPNIYTILLLVAVLALGTTIGFVTHDLLTPLDKGGYEVPFEKVFQPLDEPPPIE